LVPSIRNTREGVETIHAMDHHTNRAWKSIFFKQLSKCVEVNRLCEPPALTSGVGANASLAAKICEQRDNIRIDTAGYAVVWDQQTIN